MEVSEKAIDAYLSFYDWGVFSCRNPLLAAAVDYFFLPIGIRCSRSEFDFLASMENPAVRLVLTDPVFDPSVFRGAVPDDLAPLIERKRFFRISISDDGHTDVSVREIPKRLDGSENVPLLEELRSIIRNCPLAECVRTAYVLCNSFLREIPVEALLNENDLYLEAIVNGNFDPIFAAFDKEISALHTTS